MPELWRRSPSPVEDWNGAEGANEDGEWEVSIIGEEVDADGQVRHETVWPTWKRPDGTNTTWLNLAAGPARTNWRRVRTRVENEMIDEANGSLSIKVFDTLEMHLTDTILRAQGYESKKKLRKQAPLSAIVHRMAHLLQEKLDPLNQQSQVQARTRASTTSTLRSGSSTSRRSESRGTPYPLPSMSKKPKPSKRQRLQKLWNASASQAGAAPITIINEVDDEDIPPVDSKFEYLETGYVCHATVDRPDVADALLACDCSEVSCDPRHADRCDCQVESTLVDKAGNKVLAYTAKGLFNLRVPLGVVVVECNQNCGCPDGCINRVGQRPRDVPLQIFKTINCGWGVQATVDVPQGKVIGVYTGLLIPRQLAEDLPEALSNYCFDLDSQDSIRINEPDIQHSQLYTADSRLHGNWSRFINHSCEPNLRVYSFVYDTIPELKQPYLGFVALYDIPKYTELTVDYDPSAARELEKMKGKGKGKAPQIPGGKACHCGAPSCRGWVRF